MESFDLVSEPMKKNHRRFLKFYDIEDRYKLERL